ncbi:hypothetical protein GE061_012137 [Apolygus lucorum]|uniref:Uncharacterized protein n=1 Tax=Apolygus lucorum TaxID=248454 RepID=A0A6A4JTL0_APOLU|nr:hypothetical protein GE061_012137 [Apolygus lucorum]
MKSVALVLVFVAAALAQQRRTPLFQVTASRPTYQYQQRPVVVQQPFRAVPPSYLLRNEAAPAYAPIVSQTDSRDDKGYAYSYETGDRTVVSERGLLKPGPEGDYIVAEGSFSFVGTDGVQYTVTYKADENGFQAEGAHLPKPPAPVV